MLNWADCIMLTLIILSMLYSFMRGFAREALSIIVWLVAFWVALNCAHYLLPFMAHIILHLSLRFAAAFVVLLIAVLIVGGLISHFIGNFVKHTDLSVIDHTLGLVFGFGRGVLMVFIALFVVKLIYEVPPLWWQQSWIATKMSLVMPAFHATLAALHVNIPTR